MTYSKVQKWNYKSERYECFFPLRVVGLAYELGHKLAEKHGVCGGFFERAVGRSFLCVRKVFNVWG